ncbi:MAG TPA: DoxX family membrane protein [Planctomycetota bacterium]|jgi:uncharacterized membrane protein YphA (DoxX/SURF4 family)|nr:DoxX family membrane protein [Planctomycetota bacterium]
MKPAVLLLARLFLGLSFLLFGWAKVSGKPVFDGKPFSQSFEGFVQETLSDKGHPFGFWRPVLEIAVRRAPGVFAFLVGGGELLLGASLLLGALLRFSAIGGIALMASIQFCNNPFAGEGPLWAKVAGLVEHGAVALLLLLLALDGAGRFFGLDQLLSREREFDFPKPAP